jgi:hypothetical protein
VVACGTGYYVKVQPVGQETKRTTYSGLPDGLNTL